MTIYKFSEPTLP